MLQSRVRVLFSLIAIGLAILWAYPVPASPASAQERWAGLTETVFQNYGREQGLPPPVPTALAQDGQGFLWIGTQGGLLRWDGYRFTIYQPEAGHATAVPGGWINVLHADPRGTLWIGTDADGLARYDHVHDRFERIALTRGIDTELEAPRVHIGAIADDGQGGLWIGTDAGLYRLPDTAGKTMAAVETRLPTGQIQAILRNGLGALWLGTGQGLFVGTDDGTPFRHIPLPGADGGSVTALCEGPDGRVWIGTSQHGLYVTDAAGTAAHAVAAGETGLTGSRVSAIAVAEDHEIWVGLRVAGIVAVDTVTGRARRIRHNRHAPNSLAHDDVWTLARDHVGSMWVGGAGGLSYHARDSGVVSVIMGGPDGPAGLGKTDPSALLATRDGRIWLGYLDGGIDILDPARGRVAGVPAGSTDQTSTLPRDVVTEMAEAANGDVYVGTARGVYRVDHVRHGVTPVSVPQRDQHAQSRAVLIDDGTLWVGGLNQGLRGVGLDGGPPVFGPAESARLTDQNVFTLVRGAGNDLWIGTFDGLNRLDLHTGSVENIRAVPADPAALPARLVSSLLLDRRQRLWVGTFGGGIAVMTGRSPDGTPRFHRLGLAEGLPQLNIDRLLLDGDGNVWASTDDGLAVIDPVTFRIRALHRADGSALDVYWVKSGTTDSKGAPLFGAKGGITIGHPGLPPDWTYQPPVVVSDVRVGGRIVPGGRFNGTGPAEPLVLTPEANSLAVEFAALDYTSPERNRYAYRLDGFDREWIETGPDRRVAAYTNLPPGDYTLRLRGSNRMGAWADGDRTVPVRVLAAWHQTWWFHMCALAAVLATLVVVVRSRTAYLRLGQRRLERQIAERTADLQAANHQLYELATTDPLTGCYNRRHFVARAGEMMVASHRDRQPISLAVIDIDHFKRVNDTYGHPAGDDLLHTIGTLARGMARKTDLFARMGGEEFALLMTNTDTKGAYRVANRLRETIAALEVNQGGPVTVSIGVATLHSGEEFATVYARADAALYAAKAAGRNRVAVDPAPPP